MGFFWRGMVDNLFTHLKAVDTLQEAEDRRLFPVTGHLEDSGVVVEDVHDVVIPLHQQLL